MMVNAALNMAQATHETPNPVSRRGMSALLVSFEPDGECMHFDARALSPNRVFLASAVLFEPGERLYITTGVRHGTRVDVPAFVERVEFGDEGGESGMVVMMERPRGRA